MDRARLAVPGRVTRWPRASAVGAALLSAAALAACGSSTAESSLAEAAQTCRKIEAVLADGPEPVADPVGYAEAQVLPLRQIHTPDRPLQESIYALASAYEAFSAANGQDKRAHASVSAASRSINAICPGATS